MGIVKAFFTLGRPSSLGLGQMNGHFIARGAPRDIGNLSVQHLAEKVIAAEFLLLSPQYQLTLKTYLGGNRGGCTAMIAL